MQQLAGYEFATVAGSSSCLASNDNLVVSRSTAYTQYDTKSLAAVLPKEAAKASGACPCESRYFRGHFAF